jgi:hypothetical protein
MKIKVLQLDWWMTDVYEIEASLECYPDDFTEIPPIFNRYGKYLVKDFAWFECEHGCFTYKDLAKMIKYDLELSAQRPLRDKEVECIKYLIREGIANQELIERYRKDKDWKEIRNTGRMSRKTMISWYNERKNNRNN